MADYFSKVYNFHMIISKGASATKTAYVSSELDFIVLE